MPGTHRTPPDADGDYLTVTKDNGDEHTHVAVMAVDDYADGGVDVSPDALPALVAALAAHLTVDARRALTRDLAAQDQYGDGCECWVTPESEWFHYGSAVEPGSQVEFNPDCPKHRAAVEAARPVPHTREQDR